MLSMYHSSFFDDDNNDDDFFKHLSEKTTEHYRAGLSTMEVVSIVCSVIGIVVVLVLLCRCCRQRNRGQILSPPPPQPPGPVLQAPYPQQQFIHTPYPGPAPYPSYPAPYPAVPLSSPAPWPAAVGVPPLVPGHPSLGGHLAAPAPTAPDLTAFYGIPPPGWNTQALPPSYEQATCTNMKQQSPYNPAHPH